MMGRTHLVSAGPVGLGYAALIGAPLLLVPFIVLMALIGVVVPDLDCKGSIASKSIPLVSDFASWFLRNLSRVTYVATKGPRDEPYEGTHRHLTHTVVFAVGVSVGIYFLLGMYLDYETALVLATAFGLGCVTHDIGDSLTIMGCPFLWPLPIRGETWYEIGLSENLRFRTNGPFERYGMFPALCLSTFLLVPGVWPALVSLYGAFVA